MESRKQAGRAPADRGSPATAQRLQRQRQQRMRKKRDSARTVSDGPMSDALTCAGMSSGPSSSWR